MTRYSLTIASKGDNVGTISSKVITTYINSGSAKWSAAAGRLKRASGAGGTPCDASHICMYMNISIYVASARDEPDCIRYFV